MTAVKTSSFATFDPSFAPDCAARTGASRRELKSWHQRFTHSIDRRMNHPDPVPRPARDVMARHVLGVAFGPFILLVVIAFVRARRGGRPDETSDRDGNSP